MQEEKENQLSMEINFKTCTAEELWKYVAVHLENKGFDVILVGGAVVSIYSEGAYQSGDLDFIVNTFNKKELPKALLEIGFIKTPQRYYQHPDCHHLFLEFPTGPVEIDGQFDLKLKEVEVEKTFIKILSPTDSIIDRLEQFFVVEYGKPHGERKLFEQAVLIAKKQPVNWARVEQFFQKYKSEMFEEFKEASKP